MFKVVTVNNVQCSKT